MDAAMLRQALDDERNLRRAEGVEHDATVLVLEKALMMALEDNHLNPDMAASYIRRAEIELGAKSLMLE